MKSCELFNALKGDAQKRTWSHQLNSKHPLFFLINWTRRARACEIEDISRNWTFSSAISLPVSRGISFFSVLLFCERKKKKIKEMGWKRNMLPSRELAKVGIFNIHHRRIFLNFDLQPGIMYTRCAKFIRTIQKPIMEFKKG